MPPQPVVPDLLFHYYERSKGPFFSLSDLCIDEAEAVLDRIRKEGGVFASKRAMDYLSLRRELEDRIRTLFVAKGGLPRRDRPYYLILGACAWEIFFWPYRFLPFPLRGPWPMT